MRILLDLDGVVVKYPFQKMVKKHFNVDLDKCTIFAYDLADVLGVAPVLINTMFKDQIEGKPEFIEGALDVLNSWKDKHEIVIFTNRLKYISHEKLSEWMDKYKIPYHGISFTGQEGYHFHIDDSPAKLASTNSSIKLLFSQTWNVKCHDIMKQFKRVNSWSEIKELVR